MGTGSSKLDSWRLKSPRLIPVFSCWPVGFYSLHFCHMISRLDKCMDVQLWTVSVCVSRNQPDDVSPHSHRAICYIFPHTRADQINYSSLTLFSQDALAVPWCVHNAPYQPCESFMTSDINPHKPLWLASAAVCCHKDCFSNFNVKVDITPEASDIRLCDDTSRDDLGQNLTDFVSTVQLPCYQKKIG